MQNRQGNSALSNGAPQIPYHAPIPPSIPPTIAHLIPRLRTAINDIDIFQQMVAQGEMDSSLPNWDAILRQYTLLTGRLNALSAYLATVSSSSSEDDTHTRHSNETPLTRQIITPLNPLPPTANPLAQEAYFQAINTMPLLDVQTHDAELLSAPGWKDRDSLRALSADELERFAASTRERLRAENTVGEVLSEAVRIQSEMYEWDKRVQEEEEEDDDLFADKDDEGEENMDGKKEQADDELAPNPRPGWSLSDYVGYMDTGLAPGQSSGVTA